MPARAAKPSSAVVLEEDTAVSKEELLESEIIASKEAVRVERLEEEEVRTLKSYAASPKKSNFPAERRRSVESKPVPSAVIPHSP